MLLGKWIIRIIKWFFGIILGLVLLLAGFIYFFQDEIIESAVQEANKYLKTRVEVSKIDLTFWDTFPSVSLDFHKVFIQDALPRSTKKDTLLYSELVRLKFDAYELWHKRYRMHEIDIAPGTLHIKRDKRGRNNFDIIRTKEEQESSAFKLELDAIRLTNVKTSYTDLASEQYYAATINELELTGAFTEKRFDLQTKASFFVKRIQQGKIPFVVNQSAWTSLTLAIDQEANSIHLSNGLIRIAGLPFYTSVAVDPKSLAITLEANKLQLTDVVNSLTLEELNEVNAYKGKGIASFRLALNQDRTSGEKMRIDTKFTIQQGQLIDPVQKTTISNIQLNGVFKRENGSGSEFLSLQNIAFQTAGGPFNGGLTIQRFSAPIYKGNAHGTVDLAVIDRIFNLPKIQQITGQVELNTDFILTTLKDSTHGIEITEGSGNAELKDVLFELENDGRIFKEINGKLTLDKHQADLENLKLKLGSSDLALNGHFDQLDLFLQDKANLEIAIDAKSKHVNLADFNGTVQEGGTETVAEKSWLLPTKIRGEVKLDVGDIQLDAHHFEAIRGNMQVGKRSIIIDQLTGKNAGATVQGELGVIEIAPETFELTTNLKSTDIYFQPLFKEWNNFEQKVITAENISGKAAIQLNFKAPFTIGDGVDKDKIIAQIGIKVENGVLKNVGAFKDLTESLKTPQTRLVLKKQEIEALQNKLNFISFQTLENTITIKNSVLTIPSMLIASNAINVTTEGTHSFDNDIDYRFAFRFRDIKIQKDESEFGEVIDDGSGLQVFVRMTGTINKPIITWDTKARKEQAKENRQAAKEEAFSILKSEFGFKKNDTTVKKYVPKAAPKEEIRINFDGPKEDDPEKTEKKPNAFLEKIKEKTKKLKEKQKKEKEDEFSVERP